MVSVKLLALSIAFFRIAGAIDFNNWHPPRAGDVRGPCPGLNALANHGILPRNGQNITVRAAVEAQVSAFNLSQEIATLIAAGAVAVSDDPSKGQFSLQDLRKHGAIEHDASLSRADFHLGGDGFTFRQDIFDTVLAFFNSPNVTLTAAALARYNRVLTERYRDPHFSYTPAQQLTSYLETALYLLIMKDPQTGATPTKYVRSLFEQERLPYDQGWRPPKKIVDFFALSGTVLQLAMATPEKAPPAAPFLGSGKQETSLWSNFFGQGFNQMIFN